MVRVSLPSPRSVTFFGPSPTRVIVSSDRPANPEVSMSFDNPLGRSTDFGGLVFSGSRRKRWSTFDHLGSCVIETSMAGRILQPEDPQPIQLAELMQARQ